MYILLYLIWYHYGYNNEQGLTINDKDWRSKELDF